MAIRVDNFNKFIERLVKSLWTPSTISKVVAQRGKLWKNFHTMRISQLPATCRDLYTELGWNDIPDAS